MLIKANQAAQEVKNELQTALYASPKCAAAFSETSFAFSPTDTLPLTRRAKMLMLLQSTISLITLTAIAGAAINILAGGS